MNILLDAMGGDNAPDANIKGALKAVNQIKATITLVGKENQFLRRKHTNHKKTQGNETTGTCQ